MSEKFQLTLIAIDEHIAGGNPDIRRIQKWRGWEPAIGDYPMDGPSNKRIKIVNYDEILGQKIDPVKFERSADTGHTFSEYKIDSDSVYDGHCVSVFGTILRTLHLFEGDDALGRRVVWQFGDEPIQVYPYGYTPLGAEYDRNAKCLKFSSITLNDDSSEIIYTCASPDIVAHETAHAVLDSIAPDLMGDYAIEPHCLALHESIADLTALFLTLTMDSLRHAVLERTKGDLRKPNEFWWIAEQYGAAFSQANMQQYLRDLSQRASLKVGDKDKVSETGNIYDLSLVFSNAIFDALITEYEATIVDLTGGDDSKSFSNTGEALHIASRKLRRMLFRALDYLPASNLITFFDVAKTMLVADQFAYPKNENARIRNYLVKSFIERGIAHSLDEISPSDILFPNLFRAQSLDVLLNSNSELDSFLDAHRAELELPSGLPLMSKIFEQDKFIYRSNNKSYTTKEVVLKVSWIHSITIGEFRKVRQKIGISLAIDKESRDIKYLFSTDRRSNQTRFHAKRKNVMGLYLTHWLKAEGAENALGLTAKEREDLEGAYYYEDCNGEFQVHGMAVGLHKHT